MTETVSAGEAAHRLGIAVTTLRTWDRRYGLGPTGHEPGRHRRYGPTDLDRLAEMNRLTGQGVPAAQAAAWVLGQDRRAASRAGGGHAVAVGADGPAVRGLTRAALRLDAAELQAVISAAVAARGVAAVWPALLAPVLIHIGRKQAETGRLIEVEHLLSGEISAVLRTVGRPAGPPRILLACADEEQHTLAFEALAAALGEAGVPVRVLGARVPASALLDAVRRTGPDAVAVWSQTSSTGDGSRLRGLLDRRPAPKLVLAAGPGWHTVPPEVARPQSLAEALTLLTR
ncbi:MerR family transcriptional regulator [Hamadaea tsunoensis]|uniref:MerR family transcriptional regulator n=1 Tax=Hamadaea tsunoensis TaxID=53368 RepID=UPI00040E55FE|nr:MerR family transcriptional regulator [Hamadaea tsunoensis]